VRKMKSLSCNIPMRMTLIRRINTMITFILSLKEDVKLQFVINLLIDLKKKSLIFLNRICILG